MTDYNVLTKRPAHTADGSLGVCQPAGQGQELQISGQCHTRKEDKRCRLEFPDYTGFNDTISKYLNLHNIRYAWNYSRVCLKHSKMTSFKIVCTEFNLTNKD